MNETASLDQNHARSPEPDNLYPSDPGVECAYTIYDRATALDESIPSSETNFRHDFPEVVEDDGTTVRRIIKHDIFPGTSQSTWRLVTLRTKGESDFSETVTLVTDWPGVPKGSVELTVDHEADARSTVGMRFLAGQENTEPTLYVFDGRAQLPGQMCLEPGADRDRVLNEMPKYAEAIEAAYASSRGGAS